MYGETSYSRHTAQTTLILIKYKNIKPLKKAQNNKIAKYCRLGFIEPDHGPLFTVVLKTYISIISCYDFVHRTVEFSLCNGLSCETTV